ncbi:RmlC-like cupin [Peniophora sp. CONT]|nr:RmlC-like cupin [Peniophora sp. CONT]
MFSFVIFGVLFASAVTAAPSSSPSVMNSTFADAQAQKVAQLRLAPTQVDRINVLSDEDLVFSFSNPSTAVGTVTGAGGHAVLGISGNFPAVVGNSISMIVGHLAPCGMNTPHTHPRAAEIIYSVNSSLVSGFIMEDGAPYRQVNISAGSATVYPMGAVHFQMNPTCEPALFVSGLNNEDPGAQEAAQRFFGLPPSIVGATLGGLDVEDVAEIATFIPDSFAVGVNECLARCGIQRSSQPTAQQQPRASSNAFPTGVLASASSALAAATSTSAAATSTA